MLLNRTPKFASPSYPKENPKYKEIQENPVEFERYCHYVSLMLFAAEEILEINKESISWHNTWYNQFKKHALYFASEHFNPSDWSNGIVGLCNDSISAYSVMILFQHTMKEVLNNKLAKKEFYRISYSASVNLTLHIPPAFQ